MEKIDLSNASDEEKVQAKHEWLVKVWAEMNMGYDFINDADNYDDAKAALYDLFNNVSELIDAWHHSSK